MNLAVLTPHFEPDVAPTGIVFTRIVGELVALGHRVEVITSLPWYREHRIEPGYEGKLVRREDTSWGSILRLHPFPGRDKRNLVMRGLSFSGFTALAARSGSSGPPLDGVLAVSPPLTLGLAGARIARKRSAAYVFNIQDVYPDVAIELGAISNPTLIRQAHRLERNCYERADAITVLSDDLKQNIAPRVTDPTKIRIIPNFVDTEAIAPRSKENSYRKEFGLEGKFVVMYAGNVGLSQALDIVLEAAGALAYEDDLVFVFNGQGAARPSLERAAAGLTNVRFVDMQPAERLAEVLAAADVHVVPLKKGLARSSVPSKTYSILAAGRPLIASVDENSEVARIVRNAGAGISIAPEDAELLTKSIRRLLESPDDTAAMGTAARTFVERSASPAAVAKAYESLFEELATGS